MVLADNPIYDKSVAFAKTTISVARQVELNTITRPLINQLIRSSTSIGANISEATFGASKKDFINKITIALKEARETRYWLEILTASEYISSNHASDLLNEIDVITKILSTIKQKTASNEATKTVHY